MSDADLVYVIDDDDAVRDSLAALLTATGHAVRAYPSAEAFLDRLPTAGRGCVITDVQMPQMSGIDLLRRMEGRLGDFPMIVLTGRADVPLAVEALKAGAQDFIEKPFEPVVILTAVRKALQGLARQAERGGQLADYAQRMQALSARERDVLRGLLAGWSNKTIARELDISPRTVENYRANVMMKMQASSLSELVRMTLITDKTA
ncbi:MAG: fixJ [Phenylobacterium sp.]|nr:fixJ [Phenylobacterium sp.]